MFRTSFLPPSNPQRAVTDDLVAEIRDVFHRFQSPNSTVLSRFELKLAMTALLGFKPTRPEVDTILRCGSGICEEVPNEIGLESFVTAMSRRLALVDPDEEIRHTFNAFDRGGRGFISVDDLKSAFQEVGHHLVERTIVEIFDEVDHDHDGRVTFRDFQRLMKYRLTKHG